MRREGWGGGTPARLLILATVVALLAGCATRPPAEPVIVTKTVAKPVAVSCVPQSLGPKPVYPDTDDALRAAGPERFLQLVLAGRDLRQSRLNQVESVITTCREAAAPK